MGGLDKRRSRRNFYTPVVIDRVNARSADGSILHRDLDMSTVQASQVDDRTRGRRLPLCLCAHFQLILTLTPTGLWNVFFSLMQFFLRFSSSCVEDCRCSGAVHITKYDVAGARTSYSRCLYLTMLHTYPKVPRS